ncbi:sigma-54-dependent Fis family transcriptional regulator [Duganella sp. FT135W]|uniref:Sigma-54-dependent Fis family transcriptional regulator n=1 Tax=Duganella flavida TaxID=2692175 RepID=A0A6L8KIY6_9BURK|nr:sigma-54 dependent transcriptional regulator [Duganella flavida]MYM25794.1 sigma-54-dependent Fis family transcriptional regulator [Duganella flavida]
MTIRTLLCVSIGDAHTSAELTRCVPDWQVNVALNLAAAEYMLPALQVTIGIVLLDGNTAQLPQLDAFLRKHWELQWIAICHPDALLDAACRQLVHEHCRDFHTWPIDGFRLAHTLGHAQGVAGLRHVAPRRTLSTRMPLVGQSNEIARLRQQILRVASASAPVLIRGESGTGKELVARAIHDHSPRAGGPFVPINCAAIAPSLLQSELFGYERGAFTGATREKQGLLESADGGSVFLDEIGDLPFEQQSALLRFLQERSITRLGATRSIPVEARVIAATHVDLEAAVARGAFREDLYYRLNVLALEVPALRERKEDLAPLAEHFFHKYAAERAARLQGFSLAAQAALRAHHWPGNVRELINRIRRAMVMSEGRLIQPGDLMLTGPVRNNGSECLGGARIRAERYAIESSLSDGKSVTLIAQELGVSRMTLYRLMAKHGIPSPARNRGK